jgi:hypothetical protein
MNASMSTSTTPCTETTACIWRREQQRSASGEGGGAAVQRVGMTRFRNASDRPAESLVGLELQLAPEEEEEEDGED